VWQRNETVILLHKYTQEILQNHTQGLLYALEIFYLEEFIKAERCGNIMLHVAGQHVKLVVGFGM
jgi:hypothetical protein